MIDRLNEFRLCNGIEGLKSLTTSNEILMSKVYDPILRAAKDAYQARQKIFGDLEKKLDESKLPRISAKDVQRRMEEYDEYMQKKAMKATFGEEQIRFEHASDKSFVIVENGAYK